MMRAVKAMPPRRSETISSKRLRVALVGAVLGVPRLLAHAISCWLSLRCAEPRPRCLPGRSLVSEPDRPHRCLGSCNARYPSCASGGAAAIVMRTATHASVPVQFRNCSISAGPCVLRFLSGIISEIAMKIKVTDDIGSRIFSVCPGS
jgi:hypothetical protein